MNPIVTCILTSHRKKQFIHDAIGSVLQQSHPYWQLIIMDSGYLYNTGEFDRHEYNSDIRITVATTGETVANIDIEEHDRSSILSNPTMQGWSINECFRRGLVHGDLAVYLSDDDYFTTHTFETYVNRAIDCPNEHAWYGLADCYEVLNDGSEVKISELPSLPIGTIAGLGTDISLDCKADGGQICHRIKTAYVPWPEPSEIEDAAHCDGLWMDALGKLVTIYPITTKVLRHRRTHLSTYTRPSNKSSSDDFNSNTVHMKLTLE